MSNFRIGRYHLGRYGLAAPISDEGTITITYPLQDSGFLVIVYDPYGQKLAEFGDTIKNNPLQTIEFDHRSTGCGDLKLTFSRLPSTAQITYNTRVDVHLYGDINPWYSGYIISVPMHGTTEKTFVYKGYGFYNQLDDIILNTEYENTELSDIVKNIMQNKVEPNTDIVYAESKIYSTGYPAKKLKFSYQTAKEAFTALTEYAGNYVCGVDEYRQLYFKEVVTSINEDSRFWVGWHVHTFKPEQSISDLKNYLYIKASSTYVTTLSAAMTSSSVNPSVVSAERISIGDTLKVEDEQLYVSGKTGTNLTVTRGYNSTTAAEHAIGTLVNNTSLSSTTPRILAICSDETSIGIYKKKEDILSIPSAMSEDDAQRWGDNKLAKLKDPVTTASVDNINLRKTLIKAEGKARITSKDGLKVYELPIVKVSYKISSAGMIYSMQLGALPTENFDSFIAKLVRDARNRELLDQYASGED